MEIIYVKSSSLIHHPRTVKILKSLKKKYSIIGLGWNREKHSKKLNENFFIKLNLFNFKAPINKKSIILFFPVFWFWVFTKLFILRPQIVYAADLDTVIPCYLYKLIFRKKLVFDVVDRYAAASHISPKNSFMYSFVSWLEESYSKNSDVLITTSENFLKSFTKKPECCVLILNCAEDHNIEKIKQKKGILTLSCAAPITRGQGLGKIVDAISGLKGVNLVFAGRILSKELLDYVLKFPNVNYKGHLLPEESMELQASSDVIICLYDMRVPNYNLANSVKTFDAMMLGIPVITNISPELIEEVGCGIQVNWNDTNQIRSAIISLRDDLELRKRLGENGHKAYEQKYNWIKMENKLFEINDKLLKK